MDIHAAADLPILRCLESWPLQQISPEYAASGSPTPFSPFNALLSMLRRICTLDDSCPYSVAVNKDLHASPVRVYARLLGKPDICTCNRNQCVVRINKEDELEGVRKAKQYSYVYELTEHVECMDNRWSCKGCKLPLPTVDDKRELMRVQLATKNAQGSISAWSSLDVHSGLRGQHMPSERIFWQCRNSKCVSQQKLATDSKTHVTPAHLPDTMEYSLHCSLRRPQNAIFLWHGKTLTSASICKSYCAVRGLCCSQSYCCNDRKKRPRESSVADFVDTLSVSQERGDCIVAQLEPIAALFDPDIPVNIYETYLWSSTETPVSSLATRQLVQCRVEQPDNDDLMEPNQPEQACELEQSVQPVHSGQTSSGLLSCMAQLECALKKMDDLAAVSHLCVFSASARGLNVDSLIGTEMERILTELQPTRVDLARFIASSTVPLP